MATSRKKKVVATVQSRVRLATDSADLSATVSLELCNRLRGARAFTEGDQIAPCAILWTDPDRLWEVVIGELKRLLPELFVFGSYVPDERTGPAIWLRCVEAQTLETRIPKEETPIFYLPGVSKQQLREVEECSPELQPLVELQFRGTIWVHPNGKDWTPYAFLTSGHGGLGLEVAKDAATAEALLRALPRVLKEKVVDLSGQRLDADFFNQLLTPDLPSEVLRWMNDHKASKSGKTKQEWKAYCDQCSANLGFHPDKDGELRAAELMGSKKNNWVAVWKRFSEAPHRYPGIVKLLEQADPSGRGEFIFDEEPWPQINDKKEKELGEEFKQVSGLRTDEAAGRVRELEKTHGHRRKWVWRELAQAQLAVALEHLDRLGTLTEKPLAAATADELGELYAETGWKVDAEAMAALACCTRAEHEDPIAGTVRTLYLQWLEESARNLQSLKRMNPSGMSRSLGPVEAVDGGVIVFADGLRYDVSQELAAELRSENLNVDVSWQWAPLPAVTATAKPYVSPIAHLLKGGEAADEFTVTIASTGQRLTQERFESLLEDNGVRILKKQSLGDGEGKAWTETGTLDKRGHDLGWKLARQIEQEVQDMADRIRTLLSAGWKEVIIVTDHGWLLMPRGLPKIDLPKFAAEHRWGRCAAMKESAITTLPVVPWYWNPLVSIAVPPGVGCFRAGVEYTHGGISLQELVVPRIKVKTVGPEGSQAKILGVKWVGLRCRVTVEGAVSGLTGDLRVRAADPDTSKVEGKAARELSQDGTVSLPVADDGEEGAAAVVVLLAADGKIIHSFPTIIGGTA